MDAVKRIELQLDVSHESGLPAQSAAWVFFSAAAGRRDAPTVLFCLPGGSYTRSYYHLVIPGHPGYSFAEHLAAQGFIVVAVDHLGVGDSTHPPHASVLTSEVVAAANHSVTLQIEAALKRGDLTPELPPLAGIRKIGVGHSMGGYLAIVQQARFRSFDALVTLGTPAVLNMRTLDKFTGASDRMEKALPGPVDAAGYLHTARHAARNMFHYPDVPEAVIADDDCKAVPVPAEIMRALLFERDGRDEAALDVPLLLCFGEIDGSPDPHREPAWYKGASDISLFILPRSGHCHNMAGTRKLLWEHIARWIALVQPAVHSSR